MRTTHWLVTAILGLVLAGYAEILAAPAPEARQALAPTGKLRVGLLLGRPLSVTQDSASGEMKGVGFDLGKEFARRMGISFEPVLYPSIRPLIDGLKSDQWDVAFLVVTVGQAKNVDFTAPHLEIEFGYLVPDGSSISSLADVDRTGIRVAVPATGGADIFLSRSFKNAVVVRGSDAEALEMLKSGRADVFAGNKPTLFEMLNQLPGFQFSTAVLRPTRWLWPFRRDGTAGWPTRANSLRTRKPKGWSRPRSKGLGYAAPWWPHCSDALHRRAQSGPREAIATKLVDGASAAMGTAEVPSVLPIVPIQSACGLLTERNPPPSAFSSR